MIINNLIPILTNKTNMIECEITDIFDKYTKNKYEHYILDDTMQQGNELILFIRTIGKTIGNIRIDKFSYKINSIDYNNNEYDKKISEELSKLQEKTLIYIENHNIAATKLNLASILIDSLVNGDGLRNVIYFQGCSLKCKGCFNDHTWEFGKGEDFSIQDIVDKVKNNALCRNVTLSGGHPLEQIEGCCKLINELKRQLKSNIWLYTGYTFERLLAEASTRQTFQTILYNVDVIVDGKFDIDKKIEGLTYRGSSNQRIIDVKESLKHNNIVLLDR